MRVAVVVVLMSVLTTASEASQSCMSKTEARQHLGSVHLYWHGRDHCWDAVPGRRQHQSHRHRQIQKVQRTIDEPKWRQSMSEMLPDEAPEPTPWMDRWVNIEPPQLPIVARWPDIVQDAPPPVIERKPEPMVTPHSALIVAIALTLAIVGVLFGGMIWPTSERHTSSAA